ASGDIDPILVHRDGSFQRIEIARHKRLGELWPAPEARAHIVGEGVDRLVCGHFSLLHASFRYPALSQADSCLAIIGATSYGTATVHEHACASPASCAPVDARLAHLHAPRQYRGPV